MKLGWSVHGDTVWWRPSLQEETETDHHPYTDKQLPRCVHKAKNKTKTKTHSACASAMLSFKHTGFYLRRVHDTGWTKLRHVSTLSRCSREAEGVQWGLGWGGLTPDHQCIIFGVAGVQPRLDTPWPHWAAAWQLKLSSPPSLCVVTARSLAHKS